MAREQNEGPRPDAVTSSMDKKRPSTHAMQTGFPSCKRSLPDMWGKLRTRRSNRQGNQNARSTRHQQTRLNNPVVEGGNITG
eukprot:2040723-Ditylum_brightwellii.AAC.1